MRQIVAACIKGIPLNLRSRRAIEETLADWAHEERQATNRGRRVLTALQGVLSVARVVSVSVLRESIDFGWCRGLACRWRIAALCMIVLAAAQACYMPRGFGFENLILILPMTPLTLLAILPPALFLILTWRPVGRALPTAGAAFFLALALLLLAGLLVPLSGKVVSYLLLSSLDMTRAGVTAARWTSNSILPIAAAMHVTSWPFLGAAVVMFATKLAQSSPLRNRWWLVGVPLIYAAFVATLHLAIGTSFLTIRSVGNPETPGQALTLLITAAILMALAVAYRRGEAQIPTDPSISTS